MEQEDQIQYPGILGIIKESCNQNYSSSSSPRKMIKIFLQITLILTLPLSSINLANRQISRIIFPINIMPDDNNNPAESTRSTSDFAYLIVFVILGLLSTSAVVYAAAFIYAAKVISFEKVTMDIVPKVWKRVSVAFIRIFIILVAYNIVSAASIIILQHFIFPSTLGDFVLTLLIAAYVWGLIYLTVMWHLATVVTVLEESNGSIRALLLQYKTIKEGKMGILVWYIFASFIFVLSAIQLIIVFQVGDNNIAAGRRRRIIVSGGLSLISMSALMLFGLILQTVVYFIWSSYLLCDESSALMVDDHGDVPSLKEPSTSEVDGVQLQQV